MLITQIHVPFVACVCDRAGVFVFVCSTDLQTLPHLVRPVTIGQQISSSDLMISYRLLVSEQGQVDVTRVKSCCQTTHMKPSRIWFCFLNEFDCRFLCRNKNESWIWLLYHKLYNLMLVSSRLKIMSFRKMSGIMSYTAYFKNTPLVIFINQKQTLETGTFNTVYNSKSVCCK